jgi:Ca2+-binding RTX toxin-like protein
MPEGFMNVPTQSLSLVDAPPGFALQGNQLVVFGALDFETVPSFDVVVRAVDLYGGTYEETVHIEITDVEPTIYGTPGNDDGATNPLIFGTIEEDTIFGLGGNDLIFAGAGDDMVAAGSGNDTIMATIDDGNDDYGGGIGVDTVDYSATTAALTIALGLGAQSTETGTDTLTSIENAIGGSGNDLISGNLYANGLDGGAGNDTLLGFAGNDILIGGLGNDIMTGGAGQDEFAFGPGSGNDRIVGFDALPASGQDRLDISAFGITATTFLSRVTIEDVGADALVTIDGLANQTIRLIGVSNAMTVTVDDFILL